MDYWSLQFHYLCSCSARGYYETAFSRVQKIILQYISWYLFSRIMFNSLKVLIKYIWERCHGWKTSSVVDKLWLGDTVSDYLKHLASYLVPQLLVTYKPTYKAVTACLWQASLNVNVSLGSSIFVHIKNNQARQNNQGEISVPSTALDRCL